LPRPFRQVDVFTCESWKGNPVAVVLQAQGLDDAAMQAFARWTNLSETTFVLAPTAPGADYRLRIFTPGGELPFAGHPTLGSCHAWLEAGGRPQVDDAIVQECGVGLVRIRRDRQAVPPRLAFAAPPLRREGQADEALRRPVARALGIDPAAIQRLQWVDNGPGWLGVLLADGDAVLALRPDMAAMGDLKLGVVGPWPAGAAAQFEVRAFVPSLGVPEDPVTGSLNAGLAQWLIGAGLAPEHYVASQGTVLGRAGRVHVDRIQDDIWIGGASRTGIDGQVAL